MLTAVLIIGILAASWFLLVSPKRSEAADLRRQATKQLASNDALVLKLNELKAQSLDLPKQKAQLALMHKQVPDNPALPTLIRDLTAAGKKVGVQVMSMKPGLPAPVAIAAAAPVAAATTTGTDTSSAAGTGTTTDSGTPAPAAPIAPVAAPLYMAPITLEIAGSYFEVEQFINRLERLQRSFLVSGFTLKPGAPATGATGSTTTSTTDGLSLSITGQVFLSPNVASSTPAAAPVAAPAQ